jgi:hypothetical protein
MGAPGVIGELSSAGSRTRVPENGLACAAIACERAMLTMRKMPAQLGCNRIKLAGPQREAVSGAVA